MVRFSNTVTYVDNVERTVEFFENVFKFKCKFITEEKNFAELDTGDTLLSFASHDLAKNNFKSDYIKASQRSKPLGVEVTFICNDIHSLHKKALESGAKELRAPHEKPWGQWISHIHCPSGLLLELCSS